MVGFYCANIRMLLEAESANEDSELKRGLAGTGGYNLKENCSFMQSHHYLTECVPLDLPQDILKI